MPRIPGTFVSRLFSASSALFTGQRRCLTSLHLRAHNASPTLSSRQTLSSYCRSAFSKPPLYFVRSLSSTVNETVPQEADLRRPLQDSEKVRGPSEKQEFQAESRKLLDIVAKSLYSDHEVFIRELISNACDALERLRFLRLSGKVTGDSAYEIHLATDERNNRFILHDTGVGMTKEEMIKNLGVIARSGTREFLERVVEGGASAQSGIQLPKGAERATTAPGPQDTRSNLIGQFGVGFYAAFMVADRVEVYSKPHTPNARAYKWSSDGCTLTLAPAPVN